MTDAERCKGRYPVPQTSPPRDEPFEVTYRCERPKSHKGPHGPWRVFDVLLLQSQRTEATA